MEPVLKPHILKENDKTAHFHDLEADVDADADADEHDHHSDFKSLAASLKVRAGWSTCRERRRRGGGLRGEVAGAASAI